MEPEQGRSLGGPGGGVWVVLGLILEAFGWVVGGKDALGKNHNAGQVPDDFREEPEPRGRDQIFYGGATA